MSTTLVYSPVMRPLRDFLRDHATFASLSDRIYVGGLAKNADLPAVGLSRVGNGAPAAWVDRPLIQFDCWADDGPTAEGLACDLATVLETTTEGTVLDSDTGLRFLGASVTSVIEVPDPDDTRVHRYVVSAALTVKTVEPPPGP